MEENNVQNEELNKENTETNAESAAEETRNTNAETLQKERDELQDKYLRLYSEYDNFRKRTARERMEMFQTAGKEVIVEMLPVMDDFERALKAMENGDDIQALKTGIQLVFDKMKSTLEARGLKAMNSVGQAFDVDFHEAIIKIPAPSDELKGKVVDEVEKGYVLHDKVIRFAKVVIGE